MRDENVSAFLKGLNSYASLTPEERVKFDNCITGYINIAEVTLYHTEQGRIEEVLEMVSGNFGLRYFSYPGAKEWWDHCEKLGFADTTRQWVDDVIEKNQGKHGFWEYRPSE